MSKDKLWNIKIEGTEKDSPNEPGTLYTELVGKLIDPTKTHPSAGFVLFYDGIPKDFWQTFLAETWAKPFAKLVKFGLVQTGPTSFSGTDIPDGKTRKIYKVLQEGLKNATDFGDKEAQRRGRSVADDFDDDGGKKKNKK